MFFPSRHSIRNIALLPVLLLATACPTMTEETAAPSAFRALAQGSAANFLGTRSGNRWTFDAVPEEILSHNPALVPYLRLAVSSHKPFSLWRVGLGLNGIRSHYPLRVSLARHAEWAKIDGEWQILVNLSRLKLYPRRSFLQALSDLQDLGGTLSIWVRSPSRVREAELVFVDPSKVETPTDLEVPSVTLDRVIPEGATISSRTVSFYFSATEEAKRFYCSLDNGSFKKCVSPQTYQRLGEGNHTFKVYALSMIGEKGPVTSYKFKRISENGGVEITSISPEGSPTRSTSITVTFESDNSKILGSWKRNLWNYWTHHCENKRRPGLFCNVVKKTVQAPNFWPRDRAYCRLDGQNTESAFVLCESPVSFHDLIEGSHTLEIKPISSSKKGAVYSWSIDRTAPTMAWTVVPDPETDEGGATFEFESDEAARFECSLDDSAFSECQSPWELNVEEGTHTASARAIDLAGNVSEPVTYVWTVGGEDPEVEILGVNPQADPTAETTLSVSFSANVPATFYCFLDSSTSPPDWEDYVCNSPWQVAGLEEGSHTIAIRARDAKGNLSTAVTYSWEVDTTQPSLSLFMEEPDAVPTSSTSARFIFGGEEILNFTCKLDGGAFQNCNSPRVLTGLSDGDHVFSVVARDTAGNVSEAASFEWQVDTTAPEMQWLAIVPAENPTRIRSREFYFEANEVAEFSCELNSGGAEACQSPFVLNDLADGDHVLVVTATDSVGNQRTLQSTWTVYGPGEAFIESTNPADSLTPLTSMQVSFSSPNSTHFECQLDGGAIENCISPIEYSGLADGVHQFKVYALDVTGERGTPALHNWTVFSGPLEISDVSVSEITQDTALVTWKTNLPATSQVLYGVGHTNIATEVDAQYVTDHAVLLTDLTSFTLYRFQAVSIDAAAREAQSALGSFRTLR